MLQGILFQKNMYSTQAVSLINYNFSKSEFTAVFVCGLKHKYLRSKTTPINISDIVITHKTTWLFQCSDELCV